MSAKNSIEYIVVTNSGTVFYSSNNNTGQNVCIWGYSLAASGVLAAMNIQDGSTTVFALPSLAGAGASSTPNINAVGVKFSGNVVLTGVSTNLTTCTIFYSKE
jgi:hypothetical protein